MSYWQSADGIAVRDVWIPVFCVCKRLQQTLSWILGANSDKGEIPKVTDMSCQHPVGTTPSKVILFILTFFVGCGLLPWCSHVL